MSAPKCKTCRDTLQLVTRWYSYQPIMADHQGIFELGDVEDEVPDDDYEPTFWCDSCSQERKRDGS